MPFVYLRESANGGESAANGKPQSAQSALVIKALKGRPKTTAAVAVLFDRFLPGFALQKNGTPLQGYIDNNADSRGGALSRFAPCYEQDALSGL